jgi:hypothetical protein
MGPLRRPTTSEIVKDGRCSGALRSGRACARISETNLRLHRHSNCHLPSTALNQTHLRSEDNSQALGCHHV